MEVILRQDVEKVGLRGEVVDVAPGFARNYLLPRKLAETATPAKVAELRKLEQKRARHEAQSFEQAQEIAQRLEASEIRFDVPAGETGTLFGSVSTNPWLYFGMANVLILAALAMMDVIPIRLPAALAQRAATAGDGGRVTGTFLMGAASGLVAAPCSAPVMAAVLTWVSTTRSAVLGFVYLFVFSLGMGTLLLVLGVSAGALAALPRAGAWMLWVKRAFAVIMLGVAEYYLIEMGKLLL